MTGDLRSRLLAALSAEGRPSSDYDLNRERAPRDDRSLRRAGVLVPIVARADCARVVLTKRSAALKHHPGQVSFPGGKVDPVDADEMAAAIREASEEIGLLPAHADVLGSLPPHETVTGFTVTPCIAIIDTGFRPVREVGEVEEIFEVPFSHVMDAGNYTIQSRLWRGTVRRYYTVPWGGYYIWGATARILRALADRMAQDAGRS